MSPSARADPLRVWARAYAWCGAVSVHGRAVAQVFNDGICSVSECQLVCKDLWAAGMTRILINPRVHVYYSWRSYYMQRYVMSWVNTLVMSWAHPLVMRTSEARGSVWAIREPPARVACGIDTDDDRSGGDGSTGSGGDGSTGARRGDGSTGSGGDGSTGARRGDGSTGARRPRAHAGVETARPVHGSGPP